LFFNGDASLLRRLASPPYLLTGADLRDSKHARLLLIDVCRDGHTNIVIEFAKHPWNFGRSDIDLSKGDNALFAACEAGHTEIVKILLQPPYCVSADDVLEPCCGPEKAQRALDLAATAGHAEIFSILAHHAFRPPRTPFTCLIKYEIIKLIHHACVHDQVEILRALADPCFALTHEDIIANDNDAFKTACVHGNAGILPILAQPPFSLTGKDVRGASPSVLSCACAAGKVEIVKALALPPWNFGEADLGDAVDLARRYDREEVLSILAEPPYNAKGPKRSAAEASCSSTSSEELPPPPDKH